MFKSTLYSPSGLHATYPHAGAAGAPHPYRCSHHGHTTTRSPSGAEEPVSGSPARQPAHQRSIPTPRRAQLPTRPSACSPGMTLRCLRHPLRKKTNCPHHDSSIYPFFCHAFFSAPTTRDQVDLDFTSVIDDLDFSEGKRNPSDLFFGRIALHEQAADLTGWEHPRDRLQTVQARVKRFGPDALIKEDMELNDTFKETLDAMLQLMTSSTED